MSEQSFSGKTGMVSGQDIKIDHADFHICNYPLSLIIVGLLLFCTLGMAIGYQLHAYMMETRLVVTRGTQEKRANAPPNINES
jgi:hypothetical protein